MGDEEIVYLGRFNYSNSETELDVYANKQNLDGEGIEGITPETNLLREDPNSRDGYCCVSPRREFDIRRVLGLLRNRENIGKFLEAEKVV